jgi:hypothetical protein
MKTCRRAVSKAIGDALLARDRLEMKAVERLLAATRLERPKKRIGKRRQAHGRTH